MSNEQSSIFKDSQIRKGIIASVIASLLVVIFIQPVIRLVWSGILTFGTHVFQGFIDSIYANAARGHRNYVDVIILMLISSILSGFFCGGTFVITKQSIKPDTISKRLSRKSRLIILWILLVALHLSLIFLIIKPFSDIQLNTSFQQRLTIISPYLTNIEEKKLKASWASMEFRTDYEKIVSQIEKIANDNNAKLPILLWK
ncbi:hypothetical protein DSCO28_66950 [Desulfosarcina ovata subsp. sediminis]|uniref:Uncharacterized protein n=1 Tax=Desulfosarcina ovata subsp. sediminis TaxID=885957 RepID=A0A5K8A0P6_9BACT|nr:hypothetical protein [Desulfosarcina ovata]BBO86129.1 hypothetical protein DSCO28_66950 [Desulfosarcina ovata subsp. sediminis]